MICKWQIIILIRWRRNNQKNKQRLINKDIHFFVVSSDVTLSLFENKVEIDNLNFLIKQMFI